MISISSSNAVPFSSIGKNQADFNQPLLISRNPPVGPESCNEKLLTLLDKITNVHFNVSSHWLSDDENDTLENHQTQRLITSVENTIKEVNAFLAECEKHISEEDIKTVKKLLGILQRDLENLKAAPSSQNSYSLSLPPLIVEGLDKLGNAIRAIKFKVPAGI